VAAAVAAGPAGLARLERRLPARLLLEGVEVVVEVAAEL
jgi:hypothetical protein